MLEKHRYLLIKFRDEIASDLLVDDVLIYLESKHILDSDDKEIIRHQVTSKRRAEKLLDILPTKGFEAFDVFFKVLGEKYPHLAQLLKDGVSEDDFGNHVLDFVDSPGQLSRMSTLHHDMLTTHRVEIVEDLLVHDVLNYLQGKFVFDTEDVELIKAESTSRRKAEKLLDILLTKSDAAFYHFKDSLEEPYPHLAELLEGESLLPRRVSDAREIQEQVESILLEGGVPQRPDVFTNRARDVHRVRTALRSLKDRDGWVILHGMAGCGKTVLAADALRSPQILNECFPGGVFWIRIGQIDQAKLLMKMQNLCTQLDSDHARAPPRNLEEAKDRLRILFAHQHPRSLLILDDLWSECDLRHFDIRVRVVITTRDASISNVINGLKSKVKVSEGFTTKESLESLSQWTGKRINELPREANEIVSLTGGSPLAISMIGALLKEHRTRWKYYLKQLKKKKYDKLRTNFSYPYLTLGDAISISINNLKDELRERYMDFAMFEDDAKVPAQVLCILWDEEFEEVEDIMDDLVNKSLASKSVQADDMKETWYSIHNLQLTFLREMNTNPENLHKKLVEGYQQLYDKFDEMEDDGYIHWNLIPHMEKAGMKEEVYNLLGDLSWVVAKLNVTGPADLLNDYISVKKYKQSDNLEGFYHFVSTNAHLFVEKTLPDIIQLALQEPVTSQVYVQAKEKAKELSRNKRLYLDWCNKQEDPLDSSLMITAKVHSGAVYKCQFSKDAQKVVSCSTDNKVKVWESQSGMELLSMANHRDVVNCCSFSHDNTRIISCSADQTIRIWDSLNGDELLCFNGHSQDVFCCAFSPCDASVVSCSADKTVKIWDSKSGAERLTFTGHTDIVRWCCYSSDGSKVASCSDDTTVKVFSSKNGVVLCSLENHVNSVSFCCFMSEDQNIVAVSNNCVKVLDCSTGKEIKTFNASSNCLSLALSPDEAVVAMGFSDTTVQLWNTTSYASLGVYRGHTGWVHSVGFSSDATKLVTGSDDETIKIWTIDSSAVHDVISLRRVFDAYFGDGTVVVAVTDILNRLLFYVGEEGSLKEESEALPHKITSITFSPDGSVIAVGSEDGSVKLFNRSCQVLYTFSHHNKAVRWCSFSQDGRQLVSASDDFTAKVYTLQPYGYIFSLDNHTDKIRRCRFFNQDRKILTASLDGTVKVWESQTGTCEFTCCHSNKDYLLTCQVSHDSKKIVSASVDRFAKVWDATNGNLIHSLGPHKDVVRSVSISRDDKYICTGCDEGTLRIWDMTSGKELAHCPKQDGWIYDCHFSPDGHTIVSVSDNVRWWSIDAVLKQEFFVKGGSAKDIRFSEDFKTFVMVDDTSTLFILKQIQ